jgi:hypothetical protein
MEWKDAIAVHFGFEPSMSLHDQPGDPIVFAHTKRHGSDADRAHALRYLVKGQTYTIHDIDVGDWSSRVAVTEVPGQWFNSVLFVDPID